jgi:RND family efflux transporter MFP subunit
MNMDRPYRGPVTLALLAVIGFASACSSAQGDSDEVVAGDDTSSAEAITRIVNVEVEPVVLAGFTDYIRVTGEVEAFSDVTVSAEESGVITRFAVEKGERVRSGQILASIDDAVLGAQVAEARASAQLAAEQHERQRRLWEEEQIGSEITYLQTKYQAEIAAARLRTLEARLARTAIRSPIAGVFDEKYVEAGEMVVPSAHVARVVAIDLVKIIAGVPERFAPFVSRGAAAQVVFDIMPDREFSGSIGFVGSSVDDRSRTFPIEIVLDNPEVVVKPQMVANVQIVRSTLSDAVVVPQEVVIRNEGGYHVYVVVERDGVSFAEARAVSLGSSYDDRVVVEQGLEVGDRLITLGSQLVDDQSRIRIVREGVQVTDPAGGAER